MKEVVITGYLRSAQSRSRPADPERDSFNQLRADDLLALLIPELLKRSAVNSEDVDDLIIGTALGVSEQWSFGGKTPALLANMDTSVPARFIDQQCGSGMSAIQLGFLEIASGFADIVLACGMEHMTRVPMGPTLFKSGAMSINPSLYSDATYDHWDMETIMNMGLTAEKLADEAEIGREEMDLWALRSHKKSAEAIQAGFFAGEILPIEARQVDGDLLNIAHDQAVRPNTEIEDLSALKPIFKENGTVTAGNASPLSAGAGTILLMSKEMAEKKQLKPLAKIKSIGFAGVDPTLMGKGPVPATRMALEKANLKAKDIDFWEINEAFSVVVLNCINEFEINPDRVNIHGGGLALGHPLGATGIRLVGTLARILDEKKAHLGCATACIGGGQGISIIIERLD